MDTRVNGVSLDGGTSVTLSDATPAALGTASPGVSTEVSRADHVHEAPASSSDITTTTYDFSTATGVTLVDGTVGGTAAVSGGALVLTCPSTPAARHYSSFREAPRGVIAVPTVNGRRPVRWRVRARLVSIDTGILAYLLVSTANAYARFGFYIGDAGAYGAENNVSTGAYASGSGFPVDGTGWAEVEFSGQWGYFRIGAGVGTAEPTSWTEVARGDLGNSLPVQAHLIGATNSAPGSAVAVEWDDCTFEALP